MAASKSKDTTPAPAVVEDERVPVSLNGEYYEYEPSSEQFPADQGNQVQQVYVGLPKL